MYINIPNHIVCYTKTVLHDFGTIAHGTEKQLVVTINGAKLFMPVLVGIPSNIEANMLWAAWVSGNNEITFRMHNVAKSGNTVMQPHNFKFVVLEIT